MRAGAAGALLAAAMSVSAGCTPSPAPHSGATPLAAPGSASPAAAARLARSTGKIMHGRVRCTARLSTPLRAGSRTGLTFVLRNISNKTVSVTDARWAYGFVLRARGVTYDSQLPLETASGPVPMPTPLRSHATTSLHPAEVWIRWDGPVSIRPTCDGVELPALQTTVTASTPVPTKKKAIADVVAAAGHLFDHCTPTRAGVAVTGRIDPPSGDAPAMRASCSVDLQREGHFWVAQTLALVPPTLRGVRVEQPYEQLSMPSAGGRTAEAIAWQFVVTKAGAVPVASDTAATTRPSDKMAPDWDWTGSRWEGPGGSRCGGEMVAGGASPDLTIAFVSVCPS